MAPTEHFLTYDPLHPGLEGRVAYYYLHYSDDPAFESNFVYYPHYRNAVTAYLDAEVIFDDYGSRVTSAQGAAFTPLFARDYFHGISVHIKGPFRKLGIAFEPLGVNHFLERPLSEVAPSVVGAFPFFGEKHERAVRAAFEHPDQNPAPILDDLLMHHMRDFNQDTLREAVARILRNDGTSGVEELAAHFGLSRKTLLRHFKKHLCCSVEEYKNLVKFRNALNDYHDSKDATTFTELAYKHAYYDQPAFIRHFKSITGSTPRAFFAGLKRYGERDTFWTPRR